MAKVIGEGTIVQLEKDKPKSKCRKWQLRVPVGLDPRTGKYKTRTRRVNDMTYTQAKKALRDFIEEIEDDRVWKRTGTTFEECAADFMEPARPLRPSSRRTPSCATAAASRPSPATSARPKSPSSRRDDRGHVRGDAPGRHALGKAVERGLPEPDQQDPRPHVPRPR